jgi:hypothetical protein
MADLGFDGSNASFTIRSGNAVVITPLRGIDYDDSPPEVDVGGAADTDELVVLGRSNETLKVEFVGSKIGTLAAGQQGAVAVNLNDGGTAGTCGNVIITQVHVAGSVDQAILGDFSFAPTPAAT